MTLLTGMTEDGLEVPVQVKPDGKLVAEGLTGPQGAPGQDGATGPQGPQGVKGDPGDPAAISGTAALPGLAVVGDPNTGLYSPGADQLAISTGGTGRVFVDANGHITVGNASQSGAGLSAGGKSLSLPFSSDINGNTTGSSVTIGAKIISLSGMTGPSLFTAASLAIHQTGSTEGVGEFRWSTGDGAGVLTERLRLTNDGYLRLAAGSKGVQFGGDTAAANALNDYEEGTWTATLKGSTTDPTAPVTATGRYVKVGGLVMATVAFTLVDTTGASGNASVAGLPFMPGGIRYVGSLMTSDFDLGATTSICAFVDNSSTSIQLYGSSNNAVWSTVKITPGTGRSLVATVSYKI